MSEHPDNVSTAEEFSFEVSDADTFGAADVPFHLENGTIAMVPCVPIKQSSLNLILRDGAAPAAILAFCIGDLSGRDRNDKPMGIYGAFGPAILRQLGASMLQIADKIDGGRGKQ